MKYIRFVTEFEANWTVKLFIGGHLIILPRGAGCRRRPSRRTRKMQARARRSAAARQLQCVPAVFAKTIDSIDKEIYMLDECQQKMDHFLRGND